MIGWKDNGSKKNVWAVFTIAWLLAACAGIPPTRDTRSTVELALTTSVVVVTPTSVPVATSTLAVEPSSTPSPSAPPLPKRSCPKKKGGVAIGELSGVRRVEQVTMDYLNAGGETSRLIEALKSVQALNADAVVEDLDNDGLSEVVIAYSDSEESQAWVDVLHCEVGEYARAAEFEYEEVWFASLEFVSSLRDDSNLFVVSRVPRIRGWVDDYVAIGWDGTSWASVPLSSGLGPSQISLFDQNGDGVREIQLKAMTSVTPGGGLGRIEVSTWAWNGTEYVYSSSQYLPGTNRVHYIADAEQAWANRNPLLAVAYYEIAARSDDLGAYPTGLERISNQSEAADAYQRAFSLYRIVATWTYQGRLSEAQVYLEELESRYPDGKVGSEFVASARILIGEVQSGTPYARACLRSADELDQSIPKLVPTHLGDWGVANPMYSRTTDVCDFNVIGR